MVLEGREKIPLAERRALIVDAAIRSVASDSLSTEGLQRTREVTDDIVVAVEDHMSANPDDPYDISPRVAAFALQQVGLQKTIEAAPTLDLGGPGGIA